MFVPFADGAGSLELIDILPWAKGLSSGPKPYNHQNEKQFSCKFFFSRTFATRHRLPRKGRKPHREKLPLKAVFFILPISEGRSIRQTPAIDQSANQLSAKVTRVFSGFKHVFVRQGHIGNAGRMVGNQTESDNFKAAITGHNGLGHR